MGLSIEPNNKSIMDELKKLPVTTEKPIKITKVRHRVIFNLGYSLCTSRVIKSADYLSTSLIKFTPNQN